MNQKITSFTKLHTWKKAHSLVLKVYSITKSFPKDELYGLVNQMRRCSVSITSNIAEGFTRQSKKEKVQFYYTAKGSLVELQNQLLISRDVKYIDDKTFNDIANLTIAPTGSISLMAQTSSGMEPVYELEYIRRRKLPKGDPKTTFVDQNGDCWEEYTVLHPKYKMWLEINGVDKKYSPYHEATAKEINPIKKVELQGRLQYYIDHSISVTHNLPKETTKDEVSKIYLAAWAFGCKGCTVYREGSRTGVLVSNRDKQEEVFRNKFKF